MTILLTHYFGYNSEVQVFRCRKLKVNHLHLQRGQALYLVTCIIRHTSIVPPMKGQSVGNQRKLTHRALWDNRSRPLPCRDRLKEEPGS